MDLHTVLGALAPSDVGPTLMHEHVLWGMELTLGNFDSILDDDELMAAELRSYRNDGGSVIVDLTPSHLGRDPNGLARVSAKSGVHIVMGGGWYRWETHPASLDELSMAQLTDTVVAEFEEGVEGSGIRPGIYGEMGTGRKFMRAGEERAFRAVARAQREVGFSISTHTSNAGEVALEQLAVLRQEGVPVERIVIGHLASRRDDIDDVLPIAKTGVFIGIDKIGGSGELALRAEQRCAHNVAALVRAGHLSQITLGMDTYARSQLVSNGGRGYGYLMRGFVPRLLREGITEDEIQVMLVDNPRRVLAF